MSGEWTAGTWADVALGDNVLGGDSYPWTVVDGAVNRFDTYGDPENVHVTIERDGAGHRTADIMITKSVKYRIGNVAESNVRRFLKCVDCLSDANRCMQHGSPERTNDPILRDAVTPVNDVSPCAVVNRITTAEKSPSSSLASSPSGTDAGTGTAPSSTVSDPATPPPGGSVEPNSPGRTASPSSPVHAPGDTGSGKATQAPESSDDGSSRVEVPRETEIACRPIAAGPACPPEDLAVIEAFERFLSEREPAPPGAPHVEYDDSERAAAGALKAAGITAQVIERVLSLEGLVSHLLDTHGIELPERDTPHGRLLGVEYRALLADLHFDQHAAGQETGEKWRPRGRTPHVHPVMDRPIENPQPRSWSKR